MPARRVAHQPAFVLHRYEWSETSLILETFTRQHGRVALAAKGARRPTSSLRPVLLPLQSLLLSWGGDAEIRTLKSAEWGGGQVMPGGSALLAGYYANELLLRLLARDDAHPALFDAYAALVHTLAMHPRPGSAAAQAMPAAAQADMLHAALRAFELLLLRETGHLPALDAQTLTLAPLQPQEAYCLVPEGGLRLAHAGDAQRLSGAQWLALHAALQQSPAQRAFADTFAACADLGARAPQSRIHLRAQLRTLLHYHCGMRSLRTRELMADLQKLQAPRPLPLPESLPDPLPEPPDFTTPAAL